MNASTRLFFLLILVFVTINTLAQNGLEGKKSIYLQLGASGGFSPNLPQPVLIPQLGLDATFGIIGFRATGQFFKTSPEFDINGYLDPIKSVLTISDLKDYNSNVLLGVSPYLSFGKKALSIQPGVGLKYLMQKGATATAVYYQPPGTTILNFPDGDANRNLFMIEPNIRASFGKPGQKLRFFIEAGYLLPFGENEFSYTSRDLTGVVDTKGNIDIKALLNSKEVIKSEQLIPSMLTVGAGLQVKLFQSKEKNKCSETESNSIASSNVEPLKPSFILSVLAERTKKGSDLEKLYANAKTLGYSPSRNSNDIIGYKYSAISCKEVVPPKGIKGIPFRTFIGEILVQSFLKEGTKDQAAIVTITLIGGNQTKIRDMFIEVPKGDYSLVKENIIRKGIVFQSIIFDNGGNPALLPPAGWVPNQWQHPTPNDPNDPDDGGGSGSGGGSGYEEPTWWGGYKNCLRNNCISECTQALITCAPSAVTFGGYLGCVFLKCSGCWVKCILCQECECDWYCSWATYCCP